MAPFSELLQEIRHPQLTAQKNKLFVLRIDRFDPALSGNKFFKLKYNLAEAQSKGAELIVTAGGAWSNHIAATAAAGKKFGIRTAGIIRGEKIENPTLLQAEANGMELHFVSRGLYRNKQELAEYIQKEFAHENYFYVPEGGANENGIRGCMEITKLIDIPFDLICCACGTGTTLAGIILSLHEGQSALGIQILKGRGYMTAEVERWLDRMHYSGKVSWEINEEYDFGGYAKTTSGLLHFIDAFERSEKISLDPVYTGKLFYGIFDLLGKGRLGQNKTIIAVHTGGLQGNKGFPGREIVED